jgi:hypothetical protein
MTERVDTSAPFHDQLKMALDGVSQAKAAIQEITESDDFAAFAQTDYGFIICTTLRLEVDFLKEVADSLRPAERPAEDG